MLQKNSFFEFLLAHSTNIFVELDSRGQILYASDKIRFVILHPHPEGENIRNLLTPAQANLWISHLNNVLYQNYPDSFSFAYQGRFYNIFVYPFDNNAVFCLEDITERRQLSHHLQQTRRRMEFAERTAKLGYWELDLSRRKFYWSAEMYRIFDIEAAKLSQKRNLIREQILPQDLPLYKREITRLIKERRPVEGRVRVLRHSGKLAYCLFKAGIIYDAGNERIAGTFQDITAEEETRQALEQAREQAEKLNLAKSCFLAQASHDLRQPMQALMMFLSVLNEEGLSPRQADIVAKAEASAAGLKALLDNLLDVSKLDAGGMDYLPEDFDAAELMARICREYQTLTNPRKLSLLCRLRPSPVRSDPLLLERIIRNFLSNAFKYARSKIILSVRPLKNGIVIRVIDNGSGINPEEIPHIFDEFYQSCHIPGNRSQGAGLGLNIVKKIAGILDAQIKVRSRPQNYTAFSLFLHN